jgi:hypothetical protein
MFSYEDLLKEERAAWGETPAQLGSAGYEKKREIFASKHDGTTRLSTISSG